MNKERRKEIEQATQLLGDISEKVAELIAQIEGIRDAEQEAFDALPESFQEGDRGQTMQEAIDSLENALSELECLPLADLEGYLSEAAQ